MNSWDIIWAKGWCGLVKMYTCMHLNTLSLHLYGGAVYNQFTAVGLQKLKHNNKEKKKV